MPRIATQSCPIDNARIPARAISPDEWVGENPVNHDARTNVGTAQIVPMSASEIARAGDGRGGFGDGRSPDLKNDQAL
jgi:hypothetical protein